MKLVKRGKAIVFVADFFKGDLFGGAENNDSVLIEHLKKVGYEVKKVHSQDLRVSDLDSNSSTFIVGNFIGLTEEVKTAMSSASIDYIIYEHDHKYLKTRDPSVFANFKAPDDQIINRSFYENARAVVVLSKVCKEIAERNLGIGSVYNIGSSLWSEDKFSLLERLSAERKQKSIQYGILDSKNPIKGTKQSAEWCTNNNKEYKLIGSSDEVVFLDQLRDCEKLVFMPQVLETFCRLSAEAKMLSCKLVTTKALLGFASEECYKLSGEELISEMRTRVRNALKLFENLIENSVETTEEHEDVTVILTCYRRPHLLNEQIQSLKNQTVPPKDIWVWINDADENRNYEFDLDSDIKIFRCNHNWKFFGRFASAMLADTEYVAIYDDDTMPGRKWHENCLKTMKTQAGILGGVGCLLPGEHYHGHRRVGWSAPNNEIEEVDLVGHAWFFKRDWLQYFWSEKPHTWENGEDIHFSYTAKKYGGIRTYVPPHPEGEHEMFSSVKGMEYGVDDVATSASRNHKIFYKQRDECVKHAILNGWKLVK